MEASVLLVPGLGGSGVGHWQSIWETRNPSYRYMVQSNWAGTLSGRSDGEAVTRDKLNRFNFRLGSSS